MPVSSTFYNRALMLKFAGCEYDRFLSTDGWELRPRLARAFELAGLQAGMSVLDVGCGRGELVLRAARSGAEVTALDFSADCLKLTLQTLELASASVRQRVSLVRADASALSTINCRFDRVFCLDIVEHLQTSQLRRLFVEIRRVLKPDGYAVIHTLPNRWSLDIGYPLLRRIWGRLPADPRSHYEKLVHINEQDPAGFFGALCEAGLRSHIWIENLTTAHAQWAPALDFSDSLRQEAYPLLRHSGVRGITTWLMRTPLRLILGNDLFAIAWSDEMAAPVGEWPRGRLERVVSELVNYVSRYQKVAI